MLAVSAVFALATAAPHRETVLRHVAAQPSFGEFKATFNKAYTTVEHDVRAAVYADNVDYIEQHNKKYSSGEATFEMGVNEFSDLSHDEFKALYVGPKIEPKKVEDMDIAALPLRTTLSGTKDEVDWRTKGAVTPVKNQGQCGSCWSFSTTGSTEGRVQIATGTLTSLSEQQLMDCSKAEGNNGCQGGLMDYGFKYIVENGGLDTEADYPYEMKNGVCNKAKAAKHASTIKSYKDVPPANEDSLATAVAAGPVSVAIEADQRAFQMYKSGTFSAACGTKLDHGVLAVGYGADYWIVKNSWGATWGMEGYIQLARGTGSKGECGIASQPSYPVAGNAPPGPAPGPPSPPSPPAPPSPSGDHYEDPVDGKCHGTEEAVQITGVTGSFCSPKCEILNICPKAPEGATAKGKCVLETQGSQKPTQCALICDPSAQTGQCPGTATCKSISGTGICTYDN
jgi:cathepsin L